MKTIYSSHKEEEDLFKDEVDQGVVHHVHHTTSTTSTTSTSFCVKLHMFHES